MSDDFLLNPYAFLPRLIQGRFYIGGWSAAVFWELTNDFPLDIWVMSEGALPKIYRHENIVIRSFPVSTDAFEGTVEKEKGVLISDIHQTALDALRYPMAFGGIQSARQVWENYKDHPLKDMKKMMSYAKKSGDKKVVSFLLKEFCE